MRIFAAISLLFLLPVVYGQDVKVSVECQGSWPPGMSVPVTVVISKGQAGGFARFFQDLPQGFRVEPVETNGADFYWDNNQVNLVWLALPSVEVVKVQYLVTPDASLSGSFRLGGRFDYIVQNKERKSVEVSPLLIRLDRKAVVEEVVKVEALGDNQTVVLQQDIPVVTEQVKPVSPKVDFRVQVAIASQRLLREELESRIGCRLTYDVITLKSGNMYKYQSGSFGKYEEALDYLSDLKKCGVKDAFIVAFMGGEQISIELARSLTN